MPGPARLVVVGGGLAGLRTIEELRARGYPERITLVGAETRPPYDRPPLSKKLMTGELDDTSLRADLESLDIDVRLGEVATGLRPGTVSTDRGELDFDALVLATGASPIRLPGPGRQLVLRTLDDALTIRELLKPGHAAVHRRGRLDRRRARHRCPQAGLRGHRARSRGRRRWRRRSARRSGRSRPPGTRKPAPCCGWARRSAPSRTAASPWQTASGSRPTSSSPPSGSARQWPGSKAPASSWTTASSPTRGCEPRCPACSRRATARRSGRSATAASSGSSTGTSPCTSPRW